MSGGKAAAYREEGVAAFAPDRRSLAWAVAARAALQARLHAVEPGDWRHGGTWFAGVDALDNDRAGAVGGVPLAGAGVDAVAALGLTPERWHAGQLSVVRPGYPGQDPGEGPGAVRFRRTRDAAHVDGLLPVGPERRRMLREPHAFVLGIALTDAEAGASPLAVWPGSHRILGAALSEALRAHPEEDWPEVDLTGVYAEARRAAFARCERRTLPAAAGSAVLLHRHLLHGIAPWEAGANAGPEGRAVAYFRPLLPRLADWAT